MPSFRCTMTIGALMPGVNPAAVLPAAAHAAAELTTVEASSVDVVSGEARLTVRYTADDEDDAFVVARHIVDGTSGVAELLAAKLTQRVGGRWVRVS